LRHVFDNILLFEKTECPFERSFTVPLPDPPSAPIKKKAWTAEGKNLVSSPFQVELSPPAHSPAIIKRGEWTAGNPRETWLSRAGPIRDRGQDDKSKPGTNDSFSPVVIPDAKWGPETDKDIASADLEFVRSLRSPFINGQTGAVEVVREPTTDSPLPTENSVQESTAARVSPVDSSDSAAKGAVVRTLGQGLGEAEPFKEEARLGLAPTSKLDLSHKQPEAKGGFSLHAPYHVDDDSKDASAERGKNEAEAEVNSIKTIPQSIVASDGDTRVRSSRATGLEMPLESPAPNQGSDVTEADDLGCEGDVQSFEGSGHVGPVNLSRKRVTRMLAGRSFTAPPQHTMVASPPSKLTRQAASKDISPPQVLPTPVIQSQSPAASTDSFHSVESWHSLVTLALPSPPPSQAATPLEEFSSDTSRNEVPAVGTPYPAWASDDTATPKQATHVIPGSFIVSDSSEEDVERAPRRPRPVVNMKSAEAIGEEVKLKMSRLSSPEGRAPTRRRSHASTLPISRRALSPLPLAANFFTPPPRQTPQSRLAAVRRLPAAIVHKTVEILLSPPGHLVNLMLKVAAKIAAGEWRGFVFGVGEAGERIPVQWDYYSDGDFSGLSDDDDDADDDYMLANHSSSRSDNIPRTGIRRRSQWAYDNNEYDHGHDGWGVD
jgi:hypothetical protein